MSMKNSNDTNSENKKNLIFSISVIPRCGHSFICTTHDVGSRCFVSHDTSVIVFDFPIPGSATLDPSPRSNLR